jgi:hypothetical protein
MSNSIVREVGVNFFLPTDAKHWIPNGFATVDLEIDSEIVSDADDSDFWDAIREAAEQWCEQTHGKGSFWDVVMEP